VGKRVLLLPDKRWLKQAVYKEVAQFVRIVMEEKNLYNLT